VAPTVESLYQAALALPEDQRAELADRLLETLPADIPSQLHPAWKDELRRRSAQLDAGEVTPIPWDEVRRLGREALDRDKGAHNG
jgi:putative addiction module component (TIGR02574 family)